MEGVEIDACSCIESRLEHRRLARLTKKIQAKSHSVDQSRFCPPITLASREASCVTHYVCTSKMTNDRFSC